MYQRVSTIFGVGIAIIAVALAISLPILKPAQAGVNVYRCQGEDGEITFGQFACTSGSGERIAVESPRIGFKKPTTLQTNPENKDGERGVVSESRKPRASNSDARRLGCWKAKKMRERFQRHLRKGYRPAEGERLRRQRNEKDEYIRRFCR